MKLTKLLTLLLLLLPGIAFSQIPSVEREYLLPNPMVKVMVCTDDLTVFGLSSTGVVYYKGVKDVTFLIYPATIGLTVTDLAGYNINEMYFLTAPDVIHSFKQGVDTQIKILNSGVTRITGLAIMNAKRAVPLQGYYGKRDWLAVTTNNGLYPVFRSDVFASPRYNRDPANPGTEANWRITNSSFERVDFQYDSPSPPVCYPTATHSYYKANETSINLPEDPPYSAKVNCTLFENINYDSSPDNRLKYWGTDNGVFLKILNSCDATITPFLSGIVVNDLEELEAFKGVFDYRYIFAATSQGLYSTRASVNYQPESQNFSTVPGIDEKVNSIAFQIYRPGDNVTEDAVSNCQQTIWAATEKGIKQIKITYQNITQELKLSYSPAPMFDVGASGLIWNFCGDQTVHISVDTTNLDQSKFVVKWSNRGVFDDELQGKLSVDVNNGEWRAHLVALCEGTEAKSITAYIRQLPEPTVSIGFTGSQYACPGGSVKLNTDPKYVVQWQKDGVDIPDANSSSYLATTAGKYRVMANTCNGHFTASKEIEVFVEDIPEVILTRNNTRSLCFGESVRLTAPVISGVTYKWSSGETTREIEVTKTGSYFVTLTRAACNAVSNTEVVTVADQIFKEPTTNLKICLEREEKVTLTAPEGYPVYTWNGVRGTSNTFEVTAPGQTILSIEDARGCSASTTYIVVPGCSGVDLSKVVVANAFSPNGDGVNDTWIVNGLENNADARISVYNRYGILVFSGKGDKPTWDGKFKNQHLPTGTYYYKIWDVNSSKAIKGSITLIK